MTQRIAIIGGGAAGIMVAATLLESNENVQIDLFEKNNELGVKVSISGGGRCNVTTGITDKQLLLTKYIRGSNFLKPAMAGFPPDKVMEWFGKHNVPLKIEKDLRVFPQSDNGTDIVDSFIKIFNSHKDRMRVHFLEGVTEIVQVDNNDFELTTKKNKYIFDKVVITTGGNAYRHTGSTGDGYDFAKKFGHTITPLGPSLNSFEVKEDWCKDLKGISFQNAKIDVVLSNGERRSVIGPAIFTHFGVSGPAIFAMAAHIAFEEIKADNPTKIFITPDFQLNFEVLDKRLTYAISQNGSKYIINVLAEYIPYKLAEKILEICKIEGDKKAAEISKEHRRQVVHLLTGKLEITILSRRPGDEFVTAGGINLVEVESKTMRSKLNPNLYFAGEVLDIDGLTGGFNLQAAWATGHIAGVSIAKSFILE